MINCNFRREPPHEYISWIFTEVYTFLPEFLFFKTLLSGYFHFCLYFILFLNKTSYLHLLIEVFLERIIIDYMSIQLQNMMIIMMMNCFCGMADQKKVFGLISSKDHCQIFSPSPISNMLQDGFEPVQNLSSALVE